MDAYSFEKRDFLPINVTVSRTWDAVYQNTSDKPMLVEIIISQQVSGEALAFLIGSANPPGVALWNAGHSLGGWITSSFCVFVPPFYYYKLTCGAGTSVIGVWYESVT